MTRTDISLSVRTSRGQCARKVFLFRHLQTNIALTVRRRSWATWMTSACYGIGGFRKRRNIGTGSWFPPENARVTSAWRRRGPAWTPAASLGVSGRSRTTVCGRRPRHAHGRLLRGPCMRALSSHPPPTRRLARSWRWCRSRVCRRTHGANRHAQPNHAERHASVHDGR